MTWAGTDGPCGRLSSADIHHALNQTHPLRQRNQPVMRTPRRLCQRLLHLHAAAFDSINRGPDIDVQSLSKVQVRTCVHSPKDQIGEPYLLLVD